MNSERERVRGRERERRTGLVGADTFAEHEVWVFGGLERLDARIEPPAAHVVPEARVHRGYAVPHRVLSSNLVFVLWLWYGPRVCP